MKIEILMLLESGMKGNNPTILNENEYEIEEIELFDEDDDFHLNHLLINSKLLKWMIATLCAKHQILH